MIDTKIGSMNLDAKVASFDEWLWEIDENNIFSYSSPQIEAILGYSLDEVIGKTPLDFMPYEKAREVELPFSKMLLSKNAFHFLEHLNVHKNGSVVTLETNANPFYDSNGRFCGYRAVSRDVTLRNSNSDLFKVFGENFQGVIFRYTQFPDGSDRIDDISAGSNLIWGLNHQEISDDTDVLWSIIHPEDLYLMKSSVALSKATLKTWDHVYRIVKKDGVVRWLRAIGTPRKLLDGTVVWYTVVTDVTDTVTLEQEKTKALGSVVRTLSKAVAARDLYTAQHEERVTKIATAIAHKMGQDAGFVTGLELAATIHDIGKIQIPAEILCKPSKLTDIEYEFIKAHSDIGADFLSDIEFDWPVAEIIRQHHERLDGSGYPKGLKGEQILLQARILGVADTVEAMSSHRPYRAALGLERAAAEINRGSGEIYDAEVAQALLALIDEGVIQSLLEQA